MTTKKHLILAATTFAGLMAATSAGNAWEMTIQIGQYPPSVHGLGQ